MRVYLPVPYPGGASVKKTGTCTDTGTGTRVAAGKMMRKSANLQSRVQLTKRLRHGHRSSGASDHWLRHKETPRVSEVASLRGLQGRG
jgi:hypothetical protein